MNDIASSTAGNSTETALLIIDLQVALLAEEPTPRDLDEVIARINALADRARAKGAPVVLIQHEEHHPSLEYGSAGWQLDPRLKTRPTDLRMRKCTVDSFLETPLHTWLAERGVRQVVVCGFASEFCVDTTSRRAAALCYNVIVAQDAHTTQDRPGFPSEMIRDHHTATLVSINTFRGTIVAKKSEELFL
jgi:nicotinamidase-related amidase